ncbi:M48 family metallopeptidase [Aliiroseovarius sp. 2305UL8-7]|uniref:M48 family metallopeptidase n=1 Tax=Aliiroseovarius conchicola TaxID=3121637 RepID=UPI003528E5C1
MTSVVFANLVEGHRATPTRVAVHAVSSGLEVQLPDGEQVIWPWSELRRVPDQADRGVLVLKREPDALTRLYVGDAPLISTIHLRAGQLGKRDRTVPFPKLAVWAAGAVASVLAIIFVLVPLMATQLAAILPAEGEKALGDATFEQIRMALDETGIVGTRICENPEGNVAMRQMYERLNPAADLPYDVQIHILDHDMVNAFALPGGRIVFFRGLIDQAENPEEVAAVLAHEIGHVVNRDPTRDALRSAGSLGVLGLLFGDFAGGTVTLFLANQLINASYSQKAETTADDYAHELLERADISPAALGTMFERLAAEHGDPDGIVAHFMSHPQLSERIAASRTAATDGKEYGSVLNASEWRNLQSACGSSSSVQSDAVFPDKKTQP